LSKWASWALNSSISSSRWSNSRNPINILDEYPLAGSAEKIFLFSNANANNCVH